MAGVAGMAGVTLVAGCGGGDRDRWANSPGTNGFINLDAVKEAFRKNTSVQEFERRVNEIFEGDNLIVFQAKEMRGGFVLTAREDLNRDRRSTIADDLLFTLTVDNRMVTLKGADVNRYYKETWVYDPPAKNSRERLARDPGSGPHFDDWHWTHGWGGYFTAMVLYNSISSHRGRYRQTGQFGAQIGRNSAFEGRMAGRYGNGFRSAVRRPASRTRQNYLRRASTSRGFKNRLAVNKSRSGWGVRSQMRSTGSLKGSRTFSARAGSSGGRGYGAFRGSSGIGV
jgi:hypothetical protein